MPRNYDRQRVRRAEERRQTRARNNPGLVLFRKLQSETEAGLCPYCDTPLPFKGAHERGRRPEICPEGFGEGSCRQAYLNDHKTSRRMFERTLLEVAREQIAQVAA